MRENSVRRAWREGKPAVGGWLSLPNSFSAELMAQQGFDSFLLADAVLSRAEEDRQVGLALCREVGAVVTSVESALFDLLGKAGTPEFKLISAAVK